MSGGFVGSDFSDTNAEIFDHKEITVTDSGVELITDAVTAAGRECRQFVRVFNIGPHIVYVGAAGVTAPGGAKRGEPLYKGQWVEHAIKERAAYAITDSGKSSNVIVTDYG